MFLFHHMNRHKMAQIALRGSDTIRGERDDSERYKGRERKRHKEEDKAIDDKAPG